MPSSQAFNREAVHAQKRQAVIFAAAQAFNENSFVGTSMDQIAERLGVTKRALYHYVKNKNEILLQIFQLWLRVQDAAIEGAERHAGSAAEKLSLYAGTYVQSVLSQLVPMDRIVGEITVLAADEVKLIQDWRHRNDLRLRAIVKQGIAEGEFAQMDVRVAVYALNGAIDWIFKWLKPQGSMSPGAAGRAVAGVLLGGMLARDTHS